MGQNVNFVLFYAFYYTNINGFTQLNAKRWELCKGIYNTI